MPPSSEFKGAVALVREVLPALQGLQEHSEGIEELKDLPLAFVGVAKALPVVKTVLDGIERRLERNRTQAHSQVDKDNYRALHTALEPAAGPAKKLEEIFRGVLSDDPEPRKERYEDLTDEENTVERLMLLILQALADAAKKTVGVVTEEEGKDLAAAIVEVKKLPPSMDIKKRGKGDTFNASGNASQTIHTGRGHIYKSEGGPQFSGTFNSPIHVGSPPPAAGRG